MEAQQTGIAHVNDTMLAYDIAGSGHPLTLIHGMLLDRSSWDDQFEVFARHYQVMRYDMRGWGQSLQEQAEPAFSPRQDLLKLLDFLHIQKTYLLGLSGGGELALDFTLEHPQRVDALILVSAGISGVPTPLTEDVQTFIGQYYGALRQKNIAGAVEATLRWIVDGPDRTPEQVDARARSQSATMLTQHIQKHGDYLAHQQHMQPLEPSAVHRLAEVRVPTLIIVGDKDRPHTLAMADQLEQAIARATKVVIPGASHHLHMEQPDQFNHAVLDFLNNLDEPQPA